MPKNLLEIYKDLSFAKAESVYLLDLLTQLQPYRMQVVGHTEAWEIYKAFHLQLCDLVTAYGEISKDLSIRMVQTEAIYAVSTPLRQAMAALQNKLIKNLTNVLVVKIEEKKLEQQLKDALVEASSYRANIRQLSEQEYGNLQPDVKGFEKLRTILRNDLKFLQSLAITLPSSFNNIQRDIESNAVNLGKHRGDTGKIKEHVAAYQQQLTNLLAMIMYACHKILPDNNLITESCQVMQELVEKSHPIRRLPDLTTASSEEGMTESSANKPSLVSDEHLKKISTERDKFFKTKEELNQIKQHKILHSQQELGSLKKK